MTDLPADIMERAREVARLFVHPTAWTYEPSSAELRRAEVYFEQRLQSAAYLVVPALLAAEQRGEERERERAEDYAEALHRIVQWSEAYPVDVFPEPDFKKARELLEAGGITLDAVSASCMRHVVDGVGGIARAAIRSGAQ